MAAFLVDLFKVATPERAQGELVTVRDILDGGAAKIESELRDQPEVRATLPHTIGEAYASLGIFPRAEPLLEEALDVRRQISPGPSADVASTLAALARLHMVRDDLARAEQLEREALEMRRRLYGDQDHRVAYSLVTLGSILAHTGRTEEAEKTLRDGLDLLRKAFPEGHYVTSAALSLLGSCLTDQERYAEAEPLLLESDADLRGRRGSEDAERQAVRQRIVRLYEAWGKPGKAAPYRDVSAP